MTSMPENSNASEVKDYENDNDTAHEELKFNKGKPGESHIG